MLNTPETFSASTRASPGPAPVAQTRLLILTSLFTALTVIGAHMRVPLPLAPFSLQTFFVLLSGSMLGPFYGAASQLLYLLLGLAGLPVFTKGGGLAYVFQPTFGYLLGFPLASFMVGALIHGRQGHIPLMPVVKFSKLLLIHLIATAAILIPGVIYLWWNVNTLIGTELPLARAIGMGALIFLPADLLKIFTASHLYRVLQPRLARKNLAPASIASAPASHSFTNANT